MSKNKQKQTTKQPPPPPPKKKKKQTNKNKANLRDLIAATSVVILLKFDPNHRFFSPCDLAIWCMTSKNNRAPLLYYIKLCVSFQIHRWIQTEVTLRKRSIRVPCDLEIWWMTLENNRTPLLYYIKICASFQIHRWITLTPYMVLPLFATRFAAFAGGIRVSFIQPCPF